MFDIDNLGELNGRRALTVHISVKDDSDTEIVTNLSDVLDDEG